MNKFIDFTGRTALVTGSGSPSGIGFNTAAIMGDLGAEIALVATTDRIYQRVEELKASGVKARGYIADLMDRGQVAELVRKVADDFGRIDVLVNNAGMTQVGQEEEYSSIEKMSYESWDASINRNLNITFNVTKEVLPYMIKNSYGRIVNTSSVTGPLVSNPGESGYSAAKAGIIGMSRALAIEVARDNIMVNCVLPGWIATASQTTEESAGGENTPAGRSGSGEEVASMMVFLGSERASYITGQEFVVDGGNTIQEYKGPRDLYY